ncbi:diguanylate cyclase (GGDEF) domain-containing protein [Roseateles sp. YR242]|uniref:GGDEF domain-containing protein n=1 Tax=Roseateles sp. YR242 TaxID=1855305 RepID=UPI0008C881E6|nr:GGDEF domain-containing protein [Roseateles sp. YR242]SEL77099.1 diguanylate cyclase (GGDEF) domain-containing protein [Roseateles sp. YR242]
MVGSPQAEDAGAPWSRAPAGRPGARGRGWLPAAWLGAGVAGLWGTRLLGMLGLLGLLAGCPANPSPSVTEAPAHDRAVIAELEQQERIGLAQPQEHVRQLLTLEAGLPPGSAERLEAVSQRAALLAQVRDRTGHEAAVETIKAWPADAPARAQVPLALMLARAQWLKANGQLGAGMRMLAGLSDLDTTHADPRMLWRATLLLGYLQGDYGEVDDAVENLLKAVGQARSMGAGWRTATAQTTLAFSYFRSQQFDHAKQIMAEALATAQIDPDPVLMYTVHTMIGIVHSQDDDTPFILQAREQALRFARDAQSRGLQALAMGNLADLELRQEHYARALDLSQRASVLAQEIHDIQTEILARHNMGIAKIGLRRLDEGKRDVLQAITMDAQREASSYTADAWLELGTYLEKVDDSAGAVDAYHRSRQLFDAVLRDETRKAVLEAQARFEDQQRQREIALLNQDNHLKAEQVRSRDLQLKLWAEVGVGVLLSGALLIVAYRRVRRTNAALAQTNESLRVQSERDPLTGLANRRHFQQDIVGRCEGGHGVRGSLFLVDIDHFKRINDQWGHAAGDTVLVAVARRLRSVLREQDLVVRWGGEEFLILVRSESTDDARLLAQRLLDQIGGVPVEHGPLAIPVTASIGFASFPMAPAGLTLEWERAVDLVDTVMYMSKAHGRNKAYGVAAMTARNPEELLALAGRMESAWHQGQVDLINLLGPQLEERA